MGGQPVFFDPDERYVSLSESGDPLERLSRVVDFEIFRAELDHALNRSERSRGGRPPMDAVMMFKVLVLQALYGLSDEQVEYQIRDRLSFMRFLGLDLTDRAPDYSTVWRFREALVTAGVIERLFARFDAALKERGYLALGGQLIDASIVEAPKQRMTRDEKAQVRGGEAPPWPSEGAPQGHRCPLDGQARPREEEAGPRSRPQRAAGGRAAYPGLRLQERHQRRPPSPADPALGRDPCGRP